MPNNSAQQNEFLHKIGWGGAKSKPLAGDASDRRYLRIQDNTGKTAVLMDASRVSVESTQSFVDVAEYLRTLGLSPPEIYEADLAGGYLLLEDLGDALFADEILRHPEMELDLYQSAIDVLLQLRNARAMQRPTHDANTLANLSSLAFEAYGLLTNFDGVSTMKSALDQVSQTKCLALRDYHAENLIWLPDRNGSARTGLLDFQDAFLGHPAYDLVSLVEDARRDLGTGIGEACITYYLERSGDDPADFRRDFCILGAQRNLRILGVFSRLAKNPDKQHYVALIPRVWDNLMNDLQHSALSELRKSVLETLPNPDEAQLTRLKSQ